ncbi:hypothetical protein CEY16_09340 [Halalkalibacillus sediminis]|uniref:Uncharacterized protein n=1 Tax=Halalkalibacillus sediminis TaxID=2018042 RepID=A0A2I0QVI1_9BACI|nr:hypothetical protein [Halalkalibacillus sediminis]PKR78110.1 hypothetical protein CEY16_09340 [Halalkalibacillus sediminis]
MKKQFWLMLIAVATVLLMTACSSEGEDMTEETDEEVISEPDENEEEEGESEEGNEESTDEVEETETNDEEETESESEETVEEAEEAQETSSELNEEDAISIIEGFHAQAFVETNEDLKVVNYSSISGMIADMQEFTTEEIATNIITPMYYEEEGSVYMKPQGEFSLFDTEGEYSLSQEGENEYLVSQSRETDLEGKVEFNISIENVDGNYIITNYGIN